MQTLLFYLVTLLQGLLLEPPVLLVLIMLIVLATLALAGYISVGMTSRNFWKHFTLAKIYMHFIRKSQVAWVLEVGRLRSDILQRSTDLQTLTGCIRLSLEICLTRSLRSSGPPVWVRRVWSTQGALGLLSIRLVRPLPRPPCNLSRVDLGDISRRPRNWSKQADRQKTKCIWMLHTPSHPNGRATWSGMT